MELAPEEKEQPVKSYSLKELSVYYGKSLKTMRKWLLPFKDELGPRIGHFYNPRQVRIIFKYLGKPIVVLGTVVLKVLLGDFMDRREK